MRKAKLWMLVGLPLALAACGGGEGGEEAANEADTAATAETAPAGAMAMDTAGGSTMSSTVTLNPLGNSGISGEATVSDQAGQTQVMVRLTGGQANANHPGHIHSGTCENLGPVVAPLQAVTIGADGTGTSTSTVAQPMMNVANGQHVVNFHLPDGTPAACGVIQHQM